MKPLKLIVIGMVLLLAGAAKAQVSVSVNIGTPPPWGPVGYSEVRYYYVPDVESYYDVQESRFIYLDGGVWVHRAYLPTRYRNYDLYGGYKVVMTDYRGDAPYRNFSEYKTKYARGYHGGAQRTIGVRPGRGNSEARVTPQSNRNNKVIVHDNGKSTGHSNNKSDNHGNEKRVIHGNDKGDSHGNDKNMNKGQGHDEGHGNKK